jgi:hypothetical protein
LYRGIWNSVSKLLEDGDSKCRCGQWASTAGHYFAALVKTKAHPLETTFPKNSVNTTLEHLQPSAISGGVGAITAISVICFGTGGLRKLLKNTMEYFNGLWIDCMDRSRPKRGNTDIDY